MAVSGAASQWSMTVAGSSTTADEPISRVSPPTLSFGPEPCLSQMLAIDAAVCGDPLKIQRRPIGARENPVKTR